MTRLLGGMRGFIPIPQDGPHRPTEVPPWARIWDSQENRFNDNTIYVDAGPEVDAALWESVVKPAGAWRARQGMRFSSEPAAALHVMDAMAGWRLTHYWDINHRRHQAFFGINDWFDPHRLERFPRCGEFALAIGLAALLTNRVFGEPLYHWHMEGIGLPPISRTLFFRDVEGGRY